MGAEEAGEPGVVELEVVEAKLAAEGPEAAPGLAAEAQSSSREEPGQGAGAEPPQSAEEEAEEAEAPP